MPGFIIGLESKVVILALRTEPPGALMRRIVVGGLITLLTGIGLACGGGGAIDTATSEGPSATVATAGAPATATPRPITNTPASPKPTTIIPTATSGPTVVPAPTSTPTPIPPTPAPTLTPQLPTPTPVLTPTPFQPTPIPTPTPTPTPTPVPTPTVTPTGLFIVPIEIAAGATAQLEAFLVDQQGRLLGEAQVTWSVLDPNAGSISPFGLFTAGEVAGKFEGAVEAQAENGLADLVSATIVPGPLHQVIIAPNSVRLGKNKTQEFVAVGADEFGNRISGLGFTWAVESGGGTIAKHTGLFTAGEDVGQFANTVKAWLMEEGEVISANASVTVEPDRIAFISDRDGEPNLYIMNSDGTDVRQLTTSGIDLGRQSWSPDGRRIAYGADGGIHVISDDGAWNTTILSDGSNAFEPAWSPDGTKLAYQQWKGDSADSAEIYLMDIDGGNATALTDNSDYDDYPSWSPDGNQLVQVG